MTSNPIDQEKLLPIRDAIRKLLIDDVVPGHLHDARDILWNLYNSLDTLTPKSTMADIEWDDAQHHLAEAEHRVWGKTTMLEPATATSIYVMGRGVVEQTANSNLTPTGRRFHLVPAECDGANGPVPDRQTCTTEPVAEQGTNPLGKSNSSNPQPEDVPGAEPWIVKFAGMLGVGVRNRGGSRDTAWTITSNDITVDYVHDHEVTLLHRLAPVVEPRVLRTELDYGNAPVGTLARSTRTNTWEKSAVNEWRGVGTTGVLDDSYMHGIARTVLYMPGDGA